MYAYDENDSLQTTCTECQSVFHLNLPQLLAANGQVRCNECHEVFNANTHLIREQTLNPIIDALDIEIEPMIADEETVALNKLKRLAKKISDTKKADAEEPVSLHDVMNDGIEPSKSKNLTSLYYLIGMITLVCVLIIQWVYYDRLQLVKNPNKQQHVLSLCSFIPCDTSQFKSLNQFKLIERNIFTHPTQANALLISGFFINEAPFSQKSPSLNVNLFNLNGDVIAQRLFTPAEYSIDHANLNSIASGEQIYFKIEVSDPNTVTITYEFEFI